MKFLLIRFYLLFLQNTMLELGKTLANVENSIQTALETIQNNRKELK